MVANDVEACSGQGIHLAVDPSAAAYSIEVGSKGTKRSYSVAAAPGGHTTAP